MLRDIRTLTYQNCRIEANINRTTTFNKCTCNLTLEIQDILKNIVEKRRNCFGAISPLFHNILLPVVRFSSSGRYQILTLR